MLKSRYDAIFLGKTPWSILHALLCRKNKMDVLVIDDQELTTSSGGQRWLTMLEMTELANLGEKFQIQELTALDAFLRPARLKIQTPHVQWVTGPEARDNLREFVRKFKAFQTPVLIEALEKADITGDLLKVQKSFLDWFRTPQVRRGQMPPFVATGVAWFLEFQRVLVEELTRPYAKPQDGVVAELVAAYHAATSHVVKYNFTQHEAAYTSMRLLSPLFELDERWFERELLRELQNLGAHYKRTGVQSWQIWDNKVQAALLKSYEGVVAHERLLMYGIPPAHEILQCVFKEKVYRGLESYWEQSLALSLDEPRAELTCLTGPALMGTDIPMMLLESSVKSTRLQVLVEERPGAKPEFYRQEAAETSHPYVREALSQQDLASAQTAKPGTSWELWVEEAPEARGKSQIALHERREISIVERETESVVSGAQYWGPLMTKRFGVLGYLTELRWDVSV